ncbi:hypothetical protein QJQ45_016526 [Haematococcus lacustris]|nr:hypothetical protein QJQ45_016526 [Haematococcus lacustris]
MADIGALRNARAAMSEGLITQDDFDQIKRAFLKAQQIKAGLDAGFIREEDYVQARDAFFLFLHSLDFKAVGLSASTGPATGPSVPHATPRTHHSSAAPVMTLPKFTAPALHTSSCPPLDRPTPTPSPPPAPALVSHNGSHGSEALGPGTLPVPHDLPRLGRPNGAAGKKSMAGIGLNEQCINIFNHIKAKSLYKWITYKIDEAGTEVVVDQVGAPGSSYDQFMAALPDSQCRYAVYDYAYSNADTGQINNKLVFLHWAPLGSSIKSKMMYASTKDFLKGYLEGVGAELQGDTQEEITEQEVAQRVGAAMTRK